MTTLRWVRLLGPDGNGGPLWQLTANVLFEPADGRYVDRAPALRGLNLSGTTVIVRDPKEKKDYRFVSPELLQARIEVTGKDNTKIAAPRLSDFQEGDDRPVAIGDHDVLLSPVGAKWPDIEYENQKAQITVPAFRLSGGAIPIRFKVRTSVSSGKPLGFARFLHCDKKDKTVLWGRRLVDQSSERPPITLVPEGIEVDVWMPNPFVDMTERAKKLPEIPVRVRIEPDGGGFQARLIRVLEIPPTNGLNLTKQFRDILRELRGMQAPLVTETDTRRSVPPFSWRLFLDPTGLHVDPPDPDFWQIKVDPDLLTVRLSTDKGTGATRNAIARLDDPKRDATLELVRSQEGTTLRYALTEDGTSPQQLTASYHAVGGDFRHAILTTGGAIPVETPLREAAERRVQPEGAGRYAFLPVKQGTLQIPTVPPGADEGTTPPPRRSAFQGNCVFRRDAFVLELDNAADAEISVTWKNQKATEVTLRFGRLSGSLREALWTAEESPSPERLLPTGRRDPAALRELVPRFGPGWSNNSQLIFTSGPPNETGTTDVQCWQLALDCPDKAVLWTRCTGLPLITAAPMLTLGAASAPSELRSLVPVIVDGKLTLKSAGVGLATADVTPVEHVGFNWPYPSAGDKANWGRASVQMVSPTAPGLDYAIAPATLPAHGNVQVSLRYDLPILDELFALPTGEEPEPKKGPNANKDAPSPEVTAGVLSPKAMNGFWVERKYQLAATRTQDARATGWAKLGVEVAGPLGLAQPYAADAVIVFSADYRLDSETRPLGGYSLTWAGADPVDLSGEAALIGPRGKDELPLSLVLKNGKLVPATTTEAATLTLAGYAPDAYKTASGLADTRGTSMQTAVANAAGGVARASGFLKEPSGAVEVRALFTHFAPLAISGLGGGPDVRFWVRDLPLEDGVFDGGTNPVEGRIGPDASPFAREALQEALYEWRFFEPPCNGLPALHTVGFGKELDLSPLRLLSYKPGSSAQILFRAKFRDPLPEPDATQPFGAEEPYALGPLVVLDFTHDENGLRVSAVSAAALRDDVTDPSPADVVAKLGEKEQYLGVEKRIAFALDAELTLRIAGLADTRKKRRIGALLSAGLVLPTDEAPNALSEPRLRFKLFGSEIELELTHETGGDYVFEGAAGAMPAEGVWVETARLRRTGPGRRGWALSVTVGASMRLREGGPAVLAASRDKLRWLGLPDIGADRVEIDIARGAVWIVKETKAKLTGSATPVTGITFGAVDNLDYSAAIVVDPLDKKTKVLAAGEAVWGIACGAVQAWLSGWSCADAKRRSRLTLRSHSKRSGGKTTSEVFLDRDLQVVVDTEPKTRLTEFAFQESGISWDPDAAIVTPPTNHHDAATVNITKADPYAHQVSATLRGHPIPPEALGEVGGEVVFQRSVPMTLQVRHLLERQGRRLTWRSLDTVMLTTERLWKDELGGLTTFGPRYVKARAAYRDETQSGVNVAGVGPRTSMLSGFDDPKFLEGFQDDDTTLILLGGGPGFLDAGEQSHLFGLPWVAGFAADADLPDGFRGLMRFAGNTHSWKAAQFDALPFRPAADALPPRLPVPTSLIGGEEIAEFLRRAADSEDRQEILARASTQAYFEPAPHDAKVDRSEWPFFLRALIALKETLRHLAAPKNDSAGLPVVSLHPGLAGRLLALALRPGEIAKHVHRPAPQGEVRLLALTRAEGVLTSPLDLGAASGFDEAVKALGSVRLAELAASRIAEPHLVGMAEFEERGQRLLRARPIALRDDFDEFGREAEQLFDPAHQIYPSAALGWPEPVTAGRPAAFAMRGTADAPVISTKAGLAARSAALSTGAAVSPGAGPARYLATQARSVFEHGQNHQEATLPAPPARHLSLLAPRCRTPLREAREAAMERIMAQGATDAAADDALSELPRLNASMGLIPPAYSRSFVGLRPGVLQTHIDTMVTDSASIALDNGAAEFGRSAVMSPVIARQVRTPRSPALPDDPEFDLKTRRRTFVSIFDRHPPTLPGTRRDPARTVIIRPYASAMWRLASTARFVLDLKEASICPDALVEAQEKSAPFQLNLTLRHTDDKAFNAVDTMKRLAESGFLQRAEEGSARARLRAWLAFAGTRIDASRLNWKVPEKKRGEAEIAMKLDFFHFDIAALLEELRAPDPNLQARLHLSFLAPGNGELHFAPEGRSADISPSAGADLLESGVPVAITLPIGRKPLGRPTPDIRRRTFLFADPAFDRVLSGPGKSSQILRLENEAAMLALDRTEYDLSRTLYLAFGNLVAGAFEDLGPGENLALRLKPKTGPGEVPRVVDLSIAGTGMPNPLESKKAYAIPLSRLEAAAPNPPPKPGDRLSVEVTLKRKVGTKDVTHTLSVEVPITERVEDPRPAAVYSALGLSGDHADARTLLHAAAPAPDRVEFVDLLADLASGHIRKRAIFEWRETDLVTEPDWPERTLTKTDRAGGAQLPRELRDMS